MKLLGYLAFLIMINSNRSIAQEPQLNSFVWDNSTGLPASPTTNHQLGLAGPVCGISNNMLIVGGGANFPEAMPWRGGKKKYYYDVFVFFKNANETIINYKKTFKLPYATAYGANCNTTYGIVYAGGENESGLSKKVLLIKWDQNEESLVFENLPDLPFPVVNSVITFIDNKIYMAGGETENSVSCAFLVMDMENLSAGWRKLPDLRKPVSHAVIASRGSEIFLIGGRMRRPGTISTLYSSVYQFDIKTHIWVEKASMPYPLSAGTGLLIGSEKIFLFGGDKGETFHKAEALIADINLEKDLEKREELNLLKIKVQESHPGFSKQILQYDILTDEWEVAGNLPFKVPVTTTALTWGNNIIIPSGEIKAGVRTPDLLVGKCHQ